MGVTQNYGTEPAPGGIGVPPYKALVNFIDNHDVARFLWGVADKPADVQRKIMRDNTLELNERRPC